MIFWQSTLPQHDDHYVLQESTMNINKQLININKQIMNININLTPDQFLSLTSLGTMLGKTTESCLCEVQVKESGSVRQKLTWRMPKSVVITTVIEMNSD